MYLAKIFGGGEGTCVEILSNFRPCVDILFFQKFTIYLKMFPKNLTLHPLLIRGGGGHKAICAPPKFGIGGARAPLCPPPVAPPLTFLEILTRNRADLFSTYSVLGFPDQKLNPKLVNFILGWTF